MKNRQFTRVLVLFAVLLLAQNRCGWSTTVPKQGSGLVVICTKKAYLADIQLNSDNKMVSLKTYLSPLFSDIRYATTDNFTHQVLYRHPKLLVRLPVARALAAINEELKKSGLGLLFFDAYRPYRVTQKMWEIVPDERYAANPAKGSGHNRGAAVDLTLVNLQTGQPLPMPTPFDDFTEKAHHDYKQLDSTIIQNRKLLRTVMEQHGFVALETEWWHYSWPNAAQLFPLIDIDFKDLP